MLLEVIITILPTFIILLIIYLVFKIVTDVDISVIFTALCIGLITILPAIITMKILGIIITIAIPFQVPLIFFQLLSILNEETFKYLSIKKFRDIEHPVISSIFIGGGFALCETLFLTIGYNQIALLRSYTTLPLHIISSILLCKSLEKKTYFLYAIVLHFVYNLVI